VASGGRTSITTSRGVRRERRAAVPGDVSERQPQAMLASGGPRQERHGGRDCPRHKRWWSCQPEARVVAATATSQSTIDGGGDDLPRRER
jgi:hypothetical protein